MSKHTIADIVAAPKKILDRMPQETKIALHTAMILASSTISVALQAPNLQGADQKPDAMVRLGTLQSRVPGDWNEEIPYDPQCYKAYRVGPDSDDLYEANVTIYSLGKQPAEAAARYVERWKQGFLPPEGTTMSMASKVLQFNLQGARVTYLDVHGDYKGFPGNPATPRENFRLLAVYLDAPQGAYQIDLFGPADTVELYRNEFENWIKAFK